MLGQVLPWACALCGSACYAAGFHAAEVSAIAACLRPVPRSTSNAILSDFSISLRRRVDGAFMSVPSALAFHEYKEGGEQQTMLGISAAPGVSTVPRKAQGMLTIQLKARKTNRLTKIAPYISFYATASALFTDKDVTYDNDAGTISIFLSGAAHLLNKHFIFVRYTDAAPQVVAPQAPNRPSARRRHSV
ncbi:hypothetical protein PAPHI01_1105 [Pancytospora philotis]|nr:hypothetical protein PAPHI01_1105 [Pancytospora philotis]